MIPGTIGDTISGAILVIHDDHQVRSVIGEILGRGGYPVLQARNGAEAVRLYQQHSQRIELMVLDTVSPELARLTGTHPGLRLLGLSEPGTQHDFPSVAKPFTPGMLLAAVRSALSA